MLSPSSGQTNFVQVQMDADAASTLTTFSQPEDGGSRIPRNNTTRRKNQEEYHLRKKIIRKR
jgi:hypothetical protein